MNRDAIRREWEDRASTYGPSPAGVLFRNFGEAANAALHAWHEAVVERNFLPLLPNGARVLDLGCGYGRIAKEIVNHRDDLQVVGQDISMAYCAEFALRCGPVVQASIEAIPFAERTFDAAIAVTSLMYVDPARRADALSGMRTVIREGGHLLLVDPGIEVQKLVCAARGRRLGAPSPGNGFAFADYAKLAARTGMEVRASGANPAFTRRVLLLGGRANHTWQGRTLENGVALDLKRGRDSRLALHRWVVLRRA